MVQQALGKVLNFKLNILININTVKEFLYCVKGKNGNFKIPELAKIMG